MNNEEMPLKRNWRVERNHNIDGGTFEGFKKVHITNNEGSGFDVKISIGSDTSILRKDDSATFKLELNSQTVVKIEHPDGVVPNGKKASGTIEPFDPA